MPITTYVSGGKEYLYFIYYDTLTGKQMRVACGPKGDSESERKANELEGELQRARPFKEKFREESAAAAQYVEDESDLEIIRRAKTALALKKTLGLLFDARYIVKNHAKKFGVKLAELNERSEVVKKLLVEKYDPQFDLKREEKEEEKHLKWHWGEHLPRLKQFSFWAFKRWFSRTESLLRLIETVPAGGAKGEMLLSLSLINKMAEELGLPSLRERITRLEAKEVFSRSGE
ncbi:MAG: hypothetical protein JRN45_00460 [Nitrososphaerota archaeon]|nr:hypothetical protein [Nitrososphaerota archaeon]